jgi:hyperpolarization activated cyclic nucleotide-gated potassium channel 2
VLNPTKNLTKEDYFPVSADEEGESKKVSILIIKPESLFKLGWDLLMMLIILYQALMVPFILAFNDAHAYYPEVDFGIYIVFFMDILIGFNTAYYLKGALILDRKLIAKNYIRFWFWIDLCATFPYNWIGLNGVFQSDDKTSSYSAPQIIRLLKFFRVIRLVRLAKMKRIMVEIEDYISSQAMASFLVFIRLVVLAFFIAHWTACIWAAVAFAGELDNPVTWITHAGLRNKGSFEIYLSALYWAFTTMTTVGYGDISAFTREEMICSIIAMALACGVFAYTVGSIGGLVSKQSAEENAHRERVVALNAYMKKTNLPFDLRFRVRRYLDYIWENQKKSDVEEKEILSLLSEPLRDEIFVHTRGKIFSTCPIFENFSQSFISQLSKVLEPRMFAPADVVIEEGEKSSVLYFILQGTVDIYHHRTNSSFKEITKGKYFGEIGFFTNKPRTASVKCLDFVDILALSHDKVDFILEKFPEANEATKLLADRCKDEDYTVLRIRCYLCKKLGHVATKCKQVLINLDQEEVREKWLKSKVDTSKKIAKGQYDDEFGQRSKRQMRRLRHKAMNVVGMERSIKEMYTHNPELVNKTLLWMTGKPHKILINMVSADEEVRSPELMMKSGMSFIISEESSSESGDSDEDKQFEPQLEFDRSLIEMSPRFVRDKIDGYLSRGFTGYADSSANLLQLKAVRQSQDFID